MKKLLIILSGLFLIIEGHALEREGSDYPDPPLFPNNSLKKVAPIPTSPRIRQNDTIHYFTPDEVKERKSTPKRSRPASPAPQEDK